MTHASASTVSVIGERMVLADVPVTWDGLVIGVTTATNVGREKIVIFGKRASPVKNVKNVHVATTGKTVISVPPDGNHGNIRRHFFQISLAVTILDMCVMNVFQIIGVICVGSVHGETMFQK